MKKNAAPLQPGTKKIVSPEVFVFLAVFFGLFVYIGCVMGAVNMLQTMMKTAFRLLTDTVLYIMAIAVLAGAVSGLFSEFGVIALLNKLLSPVIRRVYGLPGASTVGIFTTYLSDNPAILALANDNNFRRYFKKYQLPRPVQHRNRLRHGTDHQYFHDRHALAQRGDLLSRGFDRKSGCRVREHRLHAAHAAPYRKNLRQRRALRAARADAGS